MKDNEKRRWIAMLRSQRLWRDEEAKLRTTGKGVLRLAEVLDRSDFR